MKRTITAILGITAVIWMAAGQADVTVMAVRLGAKDAGQLAKFYQTVFGLKEIDHVGQPATEVIMRYGASVAAAKAGNSPEFLVANRAAGVGGKARGAKRLRRTHFAFGRATGRHRDSLAWRAISDHAVGQARRG